MAGCAMEPTDSRIENTKKTTAWKRKWFVMKQLQNCLTTRIQSDGTSWLDMLGTSYAAHLS